MKGRRRPDIIFGGLPEDPQPGDYWKYLDRLDTSKAMDCGDRYAEKGNLTRTVWGYMPPRIYGVGTLMAHTVREHEDGTISVRPGDGSSNSIMHSYTGGESWHGYIERGNWREC